jgi:hypothetical protein
LLKALSTRRPCHPALNLRVRFGFEKIPFNMRSRLIVVNVAGRTLACSRIPRVSSCAFLRPRSNRRLKDFRIERQISARYCIRERSTCSGLKAGEVIDIGDMDAIVAEPQQTD